MREYEAMLILPPQSDESVVSAALERISKAAEGSGGQVTKVDRWGRRRLAYEIDHQSEAYYVIAEFRADPSTQVEMERTLSVADEVMRFKVLVRPTTAAKKGSESREKKRAATTEPKEARGRRVEQDEETSPASASGVARGEGSP